MKILHASGQISRLAASFNWLIYSRNPKILGEKVPGIWRKDDEGGVGWGGVFFGSKYFVKHVLRDTVTIISTC